MISITWLVFSSCFSRNIGLLLPLLHPIQRGSPIKLFQDLGMCGHRGICGWINPDHASEDDTDLLCISTTERTAGPSRPTKVLHWNGEPEPFYFCSGWEVGQSHENKFHLFTYSLEVSIDLVLGSRKKPVSNRRKWSCHKKEKHRSIQTMLGSLILVTHARCGSLT